MRGKDWLRLREAGMSAPLMETKHDIADLGLIVREVRLMVSSFRPPTDTRDYIQSVSREVYRCGHRERVLPQRCARSGPGMTLCRARRLSVGRSVRPLALMLPRG